MATFINLTPTRTTTDRRARKAIRTQAMRHFRQTQKGTTAYKGHPNSYAMAKMSQLASPLHQLLLTDETPADTGTKVYDICYWYTLPTRSHGGMNTARPTPIHHSITRMWAFAQYDDVILDALATHALDRKADVTHGALCLDFYRSRGSMIQKVQHRLDHHGAEVDAAIYIAIAILAWIDYKHNDQMAAMTHLRGIRCLRRVPDHDDEKWLFVAWSTARLAAIMHVHPDVGIFGSYTGEHPGKSTNETERAEIMRKAWKNAYSSPSSPAVGFGDLYDLFRHLHYVCLEEARHGTEIMRSLYELEYHLAACRYRVTRDASIQNQAVELCLLAATLHAWAREDAQTYRRELDRLLELLAVPEIISVFTTSKHMTECLVWVVVTSMLLESDMERGETRTATTLRQSSQIRFHEDYSRYIQALEDWPWALEKKWSPI